jgi:hypothetical protein
VSRLRLLAGYEVFDGNDKVNQVFSANVNGKVIRNETISGTYTVEADCTGTATYADGTRFDQFMAPDGSELTLATPQATPPRAGACLRSSRLQSVGRGGARWPGQHPGHVLQQL